MAAVKGVHVHLASLAHYWEVILQSHWFFFPVVEKLSGFSIPQFNIHRLISFNRVRSFPSTLSPCCEECASQHQNIKNLPWGLECNYRFICSHESWMLHITRQHSKRVCTAHLPTVHVSVATTRCRYWLGGMSLSEQVCSRRQWWPVSVVQGLDTMSDDQRSLGGRPYVWCWGGEREVRR